MTEAGSHIPEEAENVVHFWFEELTPEQWWRSSELDEVIEKRFRPLFEQIEKEVPETWLETPRGCLAAILVLDQFPRNIFRNQPRSFATDAEALDIAKAAISKGFDNQLTPQENIFLYIPFQHSEDISIQEQSLTLYAKLDENTYNFAKQHKDIIDRFGRFPHRNKILGRTSTPEEITFLEEGALFW